MKSTLFCLALALLGVLGWAERLAAQDAAPVKGDAADAVKLPAPAEVKELQAYPAAVTMVGADESRQLVITGMTADRLQDLSGNVSYEVADGGVVRVSSTGRVVPVANGATTITARYGDK